MPTSRGYDSTAACSSPGRTGARTPASTGPRHAGVAQVAEDHSQTGVGWRSPGRWSTGSRINVPSMTGRSPS